MIFSTKFHWISILPSSSTATLICFQLCELFWLSNVVGSHQNPIEGKDHALSYSQWPGNATHHVLPVEFPRGIRSQTYAPHNGKLSEIYQETIKTQTFYNEELYLHDGTYKTVDKPAPNGFMYPETTTHKRRYHRSLSSSAKRHKYRTPELLRPKPFFDTRIDKETGLGARNITTVEGGRAIFVCRIRHLGYNRTVSWIRKARHPVVLSSGSALFTSDSRFSITTSKSKTSWRLDINPVLAKDEGLYECQVNTRDKMSLVFKLNVAPAKAQLLGESAVYVKQGSTISLTCVINLYSEPPPDITWIHGSKVLNFDSPRGGISLETQKTRTGTTSKLLVTRAQTSDSGAYTCNPSRGRPVVADVHIITDEYPAGLHDGQTSSSGNLKLDILLSTTFVLICVY